MQPLEIYKEWNKTKFYHTEMTRVKIFGLVSHILVYMCVRMYLYSLLLYTQFSSASFIKTYVTTISHALNILWIIYNICIIIRDGHISHPWISSGFLFLYDI